MGFPIRKSADQSSFAAPRGLSQRSTSFIASQRQGIHQTPLRHLIALIFNTHPRCQVSAIRHQDGLNLPDSRSLFPDPWKGSKRPACFEIVRRRAVSPPTLLRAALPWSDGGKPRKAPHRTRVSKPTLGSISSSRCQTTAPPTGRPPGAMQTVLRGRAAPPGGARRDRTDDLLLAKQALSQLSYGPFRDQVSVISNQNI